MDENKNFFEKIFDKKILIVEWTIIILVCVFIGCYNRANAESSIKSLPYDYTWNYFAIPEQTLNIALSHASQYFDVTEDNVIVFWYEIGENSWLYQFCVAQVDDITYSSGYTYDTTDLTLNQITLHFSHSAIGFTDGNSLIDPGNQSYAPTSFSFFGTSAHFVQPTGVITQTYTHMPLYGTVVLDNKLIIGTPQDDPIIEGHATEPINDPDNFINAIDGHPIPKPDTPTITPFTPPQPQFPTIDTSTLETLLESLIETVLYGFQYLTGILTGFFSNLLSNLLTLFNYLIDSVSYAINKIIKSIQDLATDFYNNMVSLFEPLFETVSIIKELLTEFFKPFDQEQFEEAFENCEFINAVQEIDAGIENFKNAFEFAEERDHYTLYLGFMMDGYTVNYDLDFTWLYPLRQYYRPIIWAVVIYELFVFLCSQLSDYLQGRSGK